MCVTLDYCNRQRTHIFLRLKAHGRVDWVSPLLAHPWPLPRFHPPARLPWPVSSLDADFLFHLDAVHRDTCMHGWQISAAFFPIHRVLRHFCTPTSINAPSLPFIVLIPTAAVRIMLTDCFPCVVPSVAGFHRHFAVLLERRRWALLRFFLCFPYNKIRFPCKLEHASHLLFTFSLFFSFLGAVDSVWLGVLCCVDFTRTIRYWRMACPSSSSSSSSAAL
ncbi:uncharacterized protein J3D65DRAFT_355388 [Phyllosticta citribraziliensis]|uniref:Uncharacterized protein n=1 Tax=Phyllosticta citribraziliensis TaxID=989973 RepID=A0ABR1LNU6_9PEZI